MNELISQMAATQWVAATPKQKAVIRFGMIPIEMHREAFALLGETQDFHRLHSVALMRCASADGGMRA